MNKGTNQPVKKETIYFFPNKDYGECTVCGISSFKHLHRPNTLPKDFELIKDVPSPRPDGWEEIDRLLIAYGHWMAGEKNGCDFVFTRNELRKLLSTRQEDAKAIDGIKSDLLVWAGLHRGKAIKEEAMPRFHEIIDVLTALSTWEENL